MEADKSSKAKHLKPFHFKPGESGNPNGRKKMTEAEKLEAKAKRDFIKEYKDRLTESLPLISPVLIAKAIEGDMTAIKEVNDRVMGKPQQITDITSKGEQITGINYIVPDGDNS